MPKGSYFDNSIIIYITGKYFYAPTKSIVKIDKIVMNNDYTTNNLSVERQKGLATSKMHTQLDPFASKLTLMYRSMP